MKPSPRIIHTLHTQTIVPVATHLSHVGRQIHGHPCRRACYITGSSSLPRVSCYVRALGPSHLVKLIQIRYIFLLQPLFLYTAHWIHVNHYFFQLTSQLSSAFRRGWWWCCVSHVLNGALFTYLFSLPCEWWAHATVRNNPWIIKTNISKKKEITSTS